jgi:acetyltransferase-like isoleucine patch superfamily enzyme
MNGLNFAKSLDKNKIEGLHEISTTRNLTLAKNVSFGGGVMIMGGGNIAIGENTMIGAGSVIHSSTHDYNIHPMNSKTLNLDVKIGNHVWVGTGVIINPGIEIEDYSVIGSGSVITKNVKKGEIVVGVPAKPIKNRDLQSLNIK